MGIRANFNNNDLNKLQQQIIDEVFQKSIKAFQYIGEMLIAHARTNVGFMDQTGNLRSSIGYVLFVNGQVYKEAYSGSAEGVKAGKDIAKEIKATIQRESIVLVCTAGMNYALLVESRGYNVLTATENYAQSVVKSLLNQLMK